MSTAPKSANSPSSLDQARAALQTEIEGLQALQSALDDNFDQAVERVHEMKNNASHGRFIIAGIGKSGHVGRKGQPYVSDHRLSAAANGQGRRF